MAACQFPYCEHDATAEIRTTRGGVIERRQIFCDDCCRRWLRIARPAGTERTVHLLAPMEVYGQ